MPLSSTPYAVGEDWREAELARLVTEREMLMSELQQRMLRHEVSPEEVGAALPPMRARRQRPSSCRVSRNGAASASSTRPKSASSPYVPPVPWTQAAARVPPRSRKADADAPRSPRAPVALSGQQAGQPPPRYMQKRAIDI